MQLNFYLVLSRTVRFEINSALIACFKDAITDTECSIFILKLQERIGKS